MLFQYSPDYIISPCCLSFAVMNRFRSCLIRRHCRSFFSTPEAGVNPTMNAVVVEEFGGPEVLSIHTVPKPTPKKGELLIKVQACGINPVDTYIRSGTYAVLPALPYCPGKDGSGIVEAIGHETEETNGLKVGDRVYFGSNLTGAYAEYTICPVSSCVELPHNATFEAGACLGVPAFTAYRALFEKVRAQPGETVFIHGASGGVGTMAVQMARAVGMTVVGTAGTEAGIEGLKESGCRAVFNHRHSSYVDEIKAAYPQGFDVCLEMLASTNLRADLTLMAQGGRIAIIGSRGPVEINPRDIMTRELEVYGVALAATSQAQQRRAAAYISSELRDGVLRPVVALELPLKEAATAHIEVMTHHSAHVGNIILCPQL